MSGASFVFVGSSHAGLLCSFFSYCIQRLPKERGGVVQPSSSGTLQRQWRGLSWVVQSMLQSAFLEGVVTLEKLLCFWAAETVRGRTGHDGEHFGVAAAVPLRKGWDREHESQHLLWSCF